LLCLASGFVLAGEYPDQDAKPLSEVLAAAESRGINDISEVSFDDGVWEIEGYREGKAVEVHLHPYFLSVLAEHPEEPPSRPHHSLRASEIAQRLEKAGYIPISELEWKHTHWTAECLTPQGEREVTVTADAEEIRP
jgi:hypothetical protein